MVLIAQTTILKPATVRVAGMSCGMPARLMRTMKGLKLVVLSVIAGCCMLAATLKAMAHGQIAVEISTAPECPYGYYDSAPYACLRSPTGYYSTEWFNWWSVRWRYPWFHGSEEFRGHVVDRFHPDNGYVGKMPESGEKAEPNNHLY